MTSNHLAAPILTGAALLAVVLALNGCSATSDSLHHISETTYPTQKRAVGDWGPGDLPAWIPAHATDIRRLATDNGAEQVVRLRSDAGLGSACTEADRMNLPFDTRDWIPDVVSVERVDRCGDWEVTPVEHGYLAWFHATTKGQLPEG